MKKLLFALFALIMSAGSSWAQTFPQVSTETMKYYYSFTCKARTWTVLYATNDGTNKFTTDGSSSVNEEKAHFCLEEGTKAGQYYVCSRLTGKYWDVGEPNSDGSYVIKQGSYKSTEWIVVTVGDYVTLKPVGADGNCGIYHNMMTSDGKYLNFIVQPYETNPDDAHLWTPALQYTEDRTGSYMVSSGNTVKASEIPSNGGYDKIGLNGGDLVLDEVPTLPIYAYSASTLTVNEGVHYDADNNLTYANKVTLKGVGEFAITSAQAATALGVNLGTEWTGAIVPQRQNMGKVNFDAFKNGTSSRIQFNHNQGWIEKNGTTDANLELVNTPITGKTDADTERTYGFCVNGVNSGNTYTLNGAITGSGDFMVSQADGGDRTPTFNFAGDLSKWTGKFNLDNVGSGTCTVNVTTNTWNIGAGFVNSSAASRMNLVFSTTGEYQYQIINGEINNTGTGSLYVTVENRKQTFAANVNATSLAGPEKTSFTLQGTATVNVGTITGIKELDIHMSESDLGANLDGKDSYTLITCTGNSSIEKMILNVGLGSSYDGYGFYVVKEGNNIVIRKHPIVISRTTVSGKFGTICLPYDARATGAKVYTASVSNDMVVLTEIDVNDIDGGVPYVYCATEGDAQTFTKNNNVLTLSTKNGADGLMGTFSDMTAPVGSYVLQTIDGVQKFRQVVSGQEPTVGAYRCYVVAPAGEDGAGARDMSIVFGDNTTAIGNLNAILDSKAEIYDLSGRKQKSLSKGLNIVNGVTVLVK